MLNLHVHFACSYIQSQKWGENASDVNYNAPSAMISKVHTESGLTGHNPNLLFCS